MARKSKSNKREPYPRSLFDPRFQNNSSLEEVVDNFHEVALDEDAHINYRKSYPLLEEAIEKARDKFCFIHRARLTRLATSHGLSVLKARPRVARAVRMFTLAGSSALAHGDVMSSSQMGRMPYDPFMVDVLNGEIQCASKKVRDGCKALSTAIGIKLYMVAQLIVICSLLMSDIDLEETRPVFEKIIEDFEEWLDQRAWNLFAQSLDKDSKMEMVNAYIKENSIVDLMLGEADKRKREAKTTK